MVGMGTAVVVDHSHLGTLGLDIRTLLFGGSGRLQAHGRREVGQMPEGNIKSLVVVLTKPNDADGNCRNLMCKRQLGARNGRTL
jgi:hypothetical protein